MLAWLASLTVRSPKRPRTNADAIGPRLPLVEEVSCDLWVTCREIILFGAVVRDVVEFQSTLMFGNQLPVVSANGSVSFMFPKDGVWTI